MLGTSLTSAVCAKCRLAIVGPSISALGRTWHPHHFTCSYCKKPLSEETFHVEASEPYHRQCISKAFGLCCTACGRPCPELYYRDEGGTVFCADCNQRAATCAFCGRRVAAQKKCGSCLPLISNLSAAKKEFQVCVNWLETVGVPLAKNLPPVRLSLKDFVRGAASTYAQDEHHLGWTEVKWIVGYTRQTTSISVEIKSHLPALLFRGVSVHELGHVWLLTNGFDRLDPEEAEGFCELLSYLYYKTRKTKEADVQAKRIRDNPNPVYGGGFRCIVQRYRGLELHALIAELANSVQSKHLRNRI